MRTPTWLKIPKLTLRRRKTPKVANSSVTGAGELRFPVINIILRTIIGHFLTLRVTVESNFQPQSTRSLILNIKLRLNISKNSYKINMLISEYSKLFENCEAIGDCLICYSFRRSKFDQIYIRSLKTLCFFQKLLNSNTFQNSCNKKTFKIFYSTTSPKVITMISKLCFYFVY